MSASRWLTAGPFAHRGLHGSHPENSLGAAVAAAERGFGVECDVHAGADGVVLVHHDPDTARTTGQPHPIETVDAALAARLRLEGTTEPVPQLGHLLDAVAGRVPVLVELKTARERERRAALTTGVAAVLAAHPGAQVAVMSFDPRLVRAMARLAPGVPRGMLAGIPRTAPLPARVLVDRYLGRRLAGADFLGHNVAGLPSAAVARLRAGGLPVLTWTVRTAADLAAARLAADAVICEGPAVDLVAPREAGS